MQGKTNATFFSNLDLTFIYTDVSVHGITFVNVEAAGRLSYRLNGVRGDCIWQIISSSVELILTVEECFSYWTDR